MSGDPGLDFRTAEIWGGIENHDHFGFTRPGKLTVFYWTLPIEIVDLPIKDGDFHSKLLVQQRIYPTKWIVIPLIPFMVDLPIENSYFP